MVDVLMKMQITTDILEDVVVKERKTLFGNIKKTILPNQKLIYTYWLEFRIDECRFYYCEYKPILNEDGKTYTYKFNNIHTKNGLNGSIDIYEAIKARCKILHPNWKIKEECIDPELLTDYRQFSKRSKDTMDNLEGKNNLTRKALFLND